MGQEQGSLFPLPNRVRTQEIINKKEIENQDSRASFNCFKEVIQFGKMAFNNIKSEIFCKQLKDVVCRVSKLFLVESRIVTSFNPAVASVEREKYIKSENGPCCCSVLPPGVSSFPSADTTRLHCTTDFHPTLEQI